MRRVLIAPENSLWRNAAGVAAAAVLIPIALVVKLMTMPFERPQIRTAEEVAKYLRGFLDGSGGPWDWDDFACTAIADAILESIRQRAARVELPISEDGRHTLLALLAEAEGQAANRNV